MLADSVIEGSSTTGTSTYTLTGSVYSGKTFAEAFPSGGTVCYFAQTLSKSKWEMGYGTLTIGPPRTLTRTVVKSSNADSAIDWQATDVFYVFSIASADVVNGLLSGNLAAARPWWVRVGGKWWDDVAGLAVSWIDKLAIGVSTDLRVGAYDAVKALYFPDARRPSTSVGAANKTVAAADINGCFTYNNTAADRTVTLPAGSTLKDGFSTEHLGLDTAHNIILTPDAGDAIDDGATGATKTIPGKVPVTVRWDSASSKWRTNYVTPDTTHALISSLKGYVQGWTYANNGADNLDIAAGGGTDATAAVFMSGAALTKQTNAPWAIGTNAGMLDTGSIGNGVYYIWAIATAAAATVDYLCSLSSTAPTMPATYTYKRLIGYFLRSGGSIVAFTTYETEGGGLKLLWNSPTLDVNVSNGLTTSRRTDAVKVPLNFGVDAILIVVMRDASANFIGWVYSPDQADLAPGSATVAPGFQFYQTNGAVGIGQQVVIRTDATGKIAARASISSVDEYGVTTVGFNWSRR